MASRHRARKVATALPVADRPDEDDSVPMGVFTMTTRVTVRRTAHFASSNLLCRSVGFLVTMIVRLHFRVCRGYLTLVSRVLHHHPDHHLSSICPSISTSIVLRRRGTRVTHRATRHLLGARDPTTTRPQVPSFLFSFFFSFLFFLFLSRARGETNLSIWPLSPHQNATRTRRLKRAATNERPPGVSAVFGQ